MTFNLWTFLFEIVNFVVLAYILHRLLYRPLHAAIDQRRADATRVEAEAEKARADAIAVRKQLQSQVADMEKQRQELLQNARQAAEEERRRLIAESKKVIDCRQEEVQAAIQRQREDALRSLGTDVRAAAAEFADRLLRKFAGATLQEQLSRHLIDTLTQLPEDQRSRVRQDWTGGDGVVLETVSAFDVTAIKRLNDAVEAIVGEKVKLAVEMKPALLAGARLRIGGHVWDASLAGQVEAIWPRHNGNQPHG